MPEQYGLGQAIADVGNSIAQDVARYHALPPLKKARFRAGTGAGLVSFGIFAAIDRPGDVFASGLSVALWSAAAGFGLLWLFVGWRGARSPRDVMSAFWSLIAIVIFGGLTVAGAWASGLSFSDGTGFYLEAFFAACLIDAVIRFWLAARGMPGGSLEQVRAQQAHGRAREATEAEAAARLASEPASPARQFRD